MDAEKRGQGDTETRRRGDGEKPKDGETKRRRETDLEAVWGLPLTAVRCPRCGAAHLVPSEAIPPLCPLCLQGPVEPQPAYLRDEPPEQVVPYRFSERQLAGALDEWARGVWFRPPELRGDVLASRLRRYLLPLWLVDGLVEGAWRADVGFDYQVVSHQDAYRDGGGWTSQEVRETRVRWEPRAGRIRRRYENLAVPALDDHRALMARLGGFDLEQRAAYAPEAVRDSAVRAPTRDPQDAWPDAQARFTRAAEADCQQAAAADHIRDFSLQAAYSELNWTQLLLPAYVTWYREGERVWPVLVNGQSGKISGTRRASPRKAGALALILGGLALLLLLPGGLLALAGTILPPVAVIGGVLLIAGAVLALAAPLPVIGVWVHNRRE